MSDAIGLIAPALSLALLLAFVATVPPDPERALHQQPQTAEEPRRHRRRRRRRSSR